LCKASGEYILVLFAKTKYETYNTQYYSVNIWDNIMITSQYLRKKLAEIRGEYKYYKELYDWREYPKIDEVRKMINKLQKLRGDETDEH